MRNVFDARRAVLPLLLVLVAACAREADESSVQRGDMFFATDSLQQALAEYQLAVVQGGEDAEVLARVGHAYVAVGRVDRAVDFYRRAAALDAAWADQAATDLMHLAREAEAGNDRFLMATAVSEALEFVPGLGIGPMALPLARHFFRNGEYGRALPLYQRALVGNDSTPEVLFEVGQAHEEIGDCRQALFFFERFREEAARSERGRADWHIGTCAFGVARDLLDRADRGDDVEPDPALLEEALAMIDRAIEMNEPRNLLAPAWFERGEILAAMGECDAALESFGRVRPAEPSPNAAIVTRAQERIDLLRFGRGLDRFRDSGRCY